MADVDNHVQDFFLTFHGSYGVNLVESILLQDNEVNQFRFPEGYVIFHGYTVIAENVDLLRNFLTALQTGLDFVYLAHPFAVDTLGYIILEFGILDIFGI